MPVSVAHDNKTLWLSHRMTTAHDFWEPREVLISASSTEGGRDGEGEACTVTELIGDLKGVKVNSPWKVRCYIVGNQGLKN